MSDLASTMYGNGDRTLVLVHGYSGSSDDFAPIVDRLTGHCRVVLVDQPGHGGSPRRPWYSIMKSTAEIAAFVSDTFDGPVHILGHSMGGRVAVQVAVDHPELLSSLILMDTWADTIDFGGMAEMIRSIFEGPDDEISTGLGFYADQATSPDNPENAAIESGVGAEWYAQHLAHNESTFDPTAAIQFGREVFGGHPSVLAETAGFRFPATVLVGSNDEPFRGPSARLAQTIPDAELVTIEGAYHSPQLSHPDEWAAAVLAHLART